MWRCKEWNNLLAVRHGAIAPLDAKLIEAGADAMLRSIIEKVENLGFSSDITSFVRWLKEMG